MGLVAVYTARLETTIESEHKIWEVDIVKQVLGSVYTNVYVKQTALFSNHLREGLKPALGDYPQNQLKPELHQLKKVLATVHDLVEEEDDPSDETGLARLLRKVHVSVLEKYDSDEGTYEDLYEAYSKHLRDWVAASYTGTEEDRRRSEGFMSEFIASLGEKWRRESRFSKAYDPRVQRQVFALLPDLSIYEKEDADVFIGAKGGGKTRTV